MYLKVIFKNMIDNRKKYLLLLIAICMSAALFVLAFVSTRMINNMASEKITTVYGSTDLVIKANEKNKSVFFDNDIELNNIKERLPILLANTTYNDVDTSLYGVDLLKIRDFCETSILEGKELEKLGEDEVVISYKNSKKFGLNVGDSIKLEMFDKERTYKVGAIAQGKGILGQENTDFFIICSKKKIEEIYGIENKCNIMYVIAQDGENLNDIIANLKKTQEGLDFSEITVDELLSGVTSNISRPLYIMLVMVVIMSIFIIYSAEKLIVMETMPFVGTLLSIGATKKKVNVILMAEAVLVGLFGGVLGDVIGAFASYLIMDSSNEYKDAGIKTEFPLAFDICFMALIFSMLLALVSTLIPILSVNKISTKNIVLNLIEKSNKNNGKIGVIIGIILLAGSIAMTFLNHKEQNPYFSMVVVADIIISLFLLITPFVRLLIRPLLAHMQSHSVSFWLSLNSLKSSENLINNIKLAAICILTLNVICIVSTSVIDGISNVWDSYRSDIQITGIIDKENVIDVLESEDEVDMYVFTGNCERIDVKGSSTKILSLIGVEKTDEYLKYNHYFDFDNVNLNEIEKGKNILLSEAIASKYNKKENDMITLLNGDGKECVYNIAGLFNAKMESMGMVAIISDKNMEEDFKADKSISLFVSVKGAKSDIDNEYLRLKEKLNTYVTKIIKESALKETTISNNESMINLLKKVSIFNLFIGCFGIINNIMISFLQRKKELVVLQTVGMTYTKKFIMLILESAVCSFLCMIIGFGATILVSLNLSGLFRIMGTSIDIVINWKTICEYILITGSLMIISSLIVIIKDRKNNFLTIIRAE